VCSSDLFKIERVKDLNAYLEGFRDPAELAEFLTEEELHHVTTGRGTPPYAERGDRLGEVLERRGACWWQHRDRIDLKERLHLRSVSELDDFINGKRNPWELREFLTNAEEWYVISGKREYKSLYPLGKEAEGEGDDELDERMNQMNQYKLAIRKCLESPRIPNTPKWNVSENRKNTTEYMTRTQKMYEIVRILRIAGYFDPVMVKKLIEMTKDRGDDESDCMTPLIREMLERGGIDTIEQLELLLAKKKKFEACAVCERAFHKKVDYNDKTNPMSLN
jgi:hypothetical protein